VGTLASVGASGQGARVGAQTREVTFDAAIGLGDHAPEVVGARRALDVRRVRDRRLPGVAGNPELFIMPGWRLSPQGNEGVEVQAAVSQPLWLGGLPAARRRAATLERDELSARVRQRALERRLSIARAWIGLRVAELQLEHVRLEHEVSGALVTATLRLVRVGERNVLAEREARAYRAETGLRRIDAEGHAYEAALALAAALANDRRELGAGPVRTAGDWPAPALPSPDALVRLAESAADLPDAVAARIGAAAARARAAEAEAATGTLLAPGVYVQRDSPGGLVLYGMLTATLPVFDRGQRARAVAEADAERLRGEATQLQVDGRALLLGAVHEVQHQRERERLLADEIVPEAEALVAVEERLFASGEAAAFRLFEARRRLLDAKRRQVEARGARVWADVKLWLLLAALTAEEAP
jgi:outer membrane protein TolC